MRTFVHFSPYLAHLFLKWKMFQIKIVDKIKKKHILCSVTFYRKSWRLWDNVEKYGTAGLATLDKMAHVHCMLDTWGCYKHTLRICNTYYFSTSIFRRKICDVCAQMCLIETRIIKSGVRPVTGCSLWHNWVHVSLIFHLRMDTNPFSEISCHFKDTRRRKSPENRWTLIGMHGH